MGRSTSAAINSAVLKALLVAVAVVAGLLVGIAPAHAVQTFQDRVVSDNPVDFTPHVLDGDVLAVAVVGNKVILGGEFTKAQNASGGTVYSRVNILAFNKTTGVIDTGFVPSFDGKVRTLAPSADGLSVYVGGEFNNVNGTAASKITRLDIGTGQKLVAFKPGNINALVYDTKLVGNRLFIGGQFTKVNNQARSLLAELDPNTGALRATGPVAFAGTHHGGFTMVYKFDLNPAGTQLTAIGNFTTVNSLPRVQVATFDVTGPLALMSDWRTTQYEPMCYSSFQYYIRDIDYSPDGSYFVLSSTGGYGSGPPSLCDSISRWSATDRGQAVAPQWVDYSGGDSTYAIAVTGSAIYGGGHTRWFNNPFAADNDGPGAVARQGIEALDPVNGLPLSWDPGRTRGRGIFDMVATSDGLWIGSDTDLIGHYEYHGRVAFFPLAGGKVVPQPTPAALPVDVYLANQPAGLSLRTPYRIDTGGGEIAAGDGGPSWTSDTDATSPYRTGASNTAGYSPVPLVDGSVPAGTPAGIFSTERWGSSIGSEMGWDLPLPAGHHATVRLYLANRCSCTQFAGDRKFDVALDGTTVLDDYDIVADVGNDVGTMKSFDIISDGTIDIDFGHVVENPLINAIEVIDNDAPADTPPAALARRTFNGSTASATTAATGGSITWANVRGGFALDGNLYLANSDGTLTVQSFDGSTLGAATSLNLYGLTQFATEMTQMTGLFYSKGSIYFTLAGDANLYRRYFTVESGIVGAQRFTMLSAGVDWSQSHGTFFASDNLYWSNATSGDLHRLTWSDNGPVSGSDVIVSGPGIDGTSWKSGALFALPGTVPNSPPNAVIGVSCAGTACAFDGTGSTDADGMIVDYAWAFGDGDTANGPMPSHTYELGGTYTVSLIVTDDDGATAPTSQPVTVTPAAQVSSVGSARHQSDSSTLNQRVTVPPTVAAGDVMVMAMTMNSVSATIADPAGWTRQGTTVGAAMTTALWTRTAGATDAGSTVTVTTSGSVKSSLLLSAYRNAVVSPAGIAMANETTSSATHATPVLTAPAGSWLLSIWTDKTAATTSWTPPAGQSVEQTGAGTAAGHVSWLMTDSNGAVGGSVGGLAATANSPSVNATMISVVLAPTP